MKKVMKKLRSIEGNGLQPYIREMDLDKPTLVMKARLNMLNLKAHFGGKYADNLCDICKDEDTTEHLFSCPKLTQLMKLDTSVVYQNLVTELQEEVRQLRELYKNQYIKLDPSLEARIRHTLGEATRASTLLYNRIDRVKVAPTGNVSLPRLKPLPLPTFEGEVQEYASYRELFTIHVDGRADLDDVSKFTYLLGTLGRERLRIVKSLSVTAANYKIALDLLDKQYGNVHQTLVILHRKLANIFVPSLDPVEVKRFRFELTIIIEQIKRLSSNDIGHGMVMSLINQKLSEGKLYRKVVEHLRKCDYTLDEFFDAIDFIIRMLEDDALQQGDKLEPGKRVDISVRAKTKPVHNNSCPFCNELHPPHGCRQVTDVAARRRILLKRGLCFNCTKSGHRSDKCPVPNSCKNCNANHHTAICDNYNAGRRPQSGPSNSSSPSTMSRPVVNATPQQHETGPRPSKDKVESKQCKSAKIAQTSDVDLPCTILPTAMAEVNHKQGSKRVRLFLDSGSQKSFISAKTARQLGLPVVGRVALNIAPFGSAEISGQYDVVSCRVEMGKKIVRMKLVAHENVDVPIHNAGYVQVRQHLLSKGVTLADPENKSDVLKNVYILVGADYFSYFILGIEKVDGINLFLTHNGMSPYGKVPQWLLEGKRIKQVKTLRVCKIASEPYQFDVDKWWRLDRVGIAPSEQYTVREAEAMRNVSQSVVKKPEGYQGVINEYLEAGFISEVKEPKVEGYHMSHFGIKEDSRTTPLRIVFNASAKSKGHKSLNECLLPGPNLV
ncbi:uncharacterized protein [Palaemon carinicauda]|uniref:uncharacterized protein n=1 Tax=Palaemon carinicauda TaxID=392227 RepID=UPI0035B6AA3D